MALSLLIICFGLQHTNAQPNQTVCTAACLGGGGSTICYGPFPANTEVKWKPCGASEDNPQWWAFTASKTAQTIKFDIVATNCTVGDGVEVALWEGDDCDSLKAVGTCFVGLKGSIQADILPYRNYYLQIDGVKGDRCNVNFTYPVSQILTKWEAPIIDGPNQICVGSSVEYTATMNGFVPPEMTWTVAPSATLATNYTKVPPLPAHKVKVTFNNPGTYQMCARGKSRCVPSGNQGCKSVEVFALPDVNDDLTLCAEESPYKYYNIQVKADEAMVVASAQYGIFPNLTGTATPSCFYINLPSIGGIINKVFPYTITPSGCKGKINLQLNTAPLHIIKLGNFAICEGDSIKIVGQERDCTNAGSQIQSIKVIVPGAYPNCDTTYTYKLFCLKINPSIMPIASLYPTHTSDTLRTSAIVFPLNNFTNTGTITYKWNTGSTDSKLFVSKPGTYTVSVTYTYRINELPNTLQNPLIKTCTKAISYTVTSAPIGAIDYKCSKIKPYNYTAIVTFSGGNPPFYANNKIIKQKYFSIPNIPNGQSFTQTFKDNNGQLFTVKGSKTCTGKYLQAQDKPTETEDETMESAPNIEILDNKIVNLNEDWRIENVTIYNLQGQLLCAFDNVENLDLQACMAQYPTSMYIIKTTLISEKGEKRMVVKKLSVGN